MNFLDSMHHHLLTEKVSYRNWHKHPNHSHVHWMFFLAYAFMVSSGLLMSINTYANSFPLIAELNASPSISKASFHATTKLEYIKPVQDHILVKFKSNVDSNRQSEVLARHKLKEKSEIKQLGIKIVSISQENTPEEEVQNLKAQEKSDIEFAEVDAFFEPSLTPNDPYYSMQSHLSKIAGSAAWDLESSGSSVTIAILDSGVDPTHPDLAPHLVPGWNFMSNNADTHDINGHGTWVSGLAAAVVNNGIGIAGVSSKALIMPMLIADVNGYGNTTAIANSLVWAADRGARVANISYGGISFSSTINTAAEYFISKGGVITTSAGNNGSFISATDNPNFIVVSATNINDESASWSTYGNNVDVSAPGEQLVTTANGGTYGAGTGTSGSAPIVAGIAAMIVSVNPQLSPAQITSSIQNSATDKGPSGWDAKYGYGRVHAFNAISSALGRSLDTTAPSVPATVTTNAPFNTIVDISWTPATDAIGVTGYGIHRNGTLIGFSNTTTYRDSAIPDTQATYTYEIKARDAADNFSNTSNPTSIDLSFAPQDTVAPTTPTNLNAQGQRTATGVQGAIYFTVSTDNALIEGYDLFRDGIEIHHCVGTGTPCVDSSAQPGATYSYALRAVDLSGNKSGISASATAVIPTIPDTTGPTSPTNLSASIQNNASINLAWTASSDNIGVVGYHLYRNNVEIATPATNSFSDINVVPDTSYTYFVHAFDAAGNVSASSNHVTSTISSVVEPPVTTPLSITSYQVVNKTTTGAQINVKTNKSSTVKVVYGTSSKSMTNIALDSTSTTDHIIPLTGLKANATYYYKITVTAGSEVVTQSSASTFKTLRR